MGTSVPRQRDSVHSESGQVLAIAGRRMVCHQEWNEDGAFHSSSSLCGASTTHFEGGERSMRFCRGDNVDHSSEQRIHGV